MTALAKLVMDAATDPLRHAREHAQKGARVIGVVGAEAPVELVIAAGAMPVAVPAFAGDRTADADRHLEPAFSPRVRSVTEQWLQGRLDFIEAVIFTRADDSEQRCYYYLCELQRRGQARGPIPLIFDIAKIPRAASLKHSEAATRALAQALSSDPARLDAAIGVRDRRRSLFGRLERLRRSDRPPPGSDCERLLRLADTLPAERFDTTLAAWLEEQFPERHGPRLLLAGTTPPDGRLHEAVEEAGGCIVGEIDNEGIDRLGPMIGAASEPLGDLALHYHARSYGPRGFGDRTSRLVRRAGEYAVDGVVSWLIEEDEASAWHVPATVAALEAAGMPLLSLTRRSWDAGDGALERIAAFTRELRNRS